MDESDLYERQEEIQVDLDEALETESKLSVLLGKNPNHETATFGTVYDISLTDENELELHVHSPDSRKWTFSFDLDNSRCRETVNRLFNNANVDKSRYADIIGSKVPIIKINDTWGLQVPPNPDSIRYNLSRKLADKNYMTCATHSVVPSPKYYHSLFAALGILSGVSTGSFILTLMGGFLSLAFGMIIFLLLLLLIPTYVVRKGEPNPDFN